MGGELGLIFIVLQIKCILYIEIQLKIITGNEVLNIRILVIRNDYKRDFVYRKIFWVDVIYLIEVHTEYNCCVFNEIPTAC